MHLVQSAEYCSFQYLQVKIWLSVL